MGSTLRRLTSVSEQNILARSMFFFFFFFPREIYGVKRFTEINLENLIRLVTFSGIFSQIRVLVNIIGKSTLTLYCAIDAEIFQDRSKSSYNEVTGPKPLLSFSLLRSLLTSFEKWEGEGGSLLSVKFRLINFPSHPQQFRAYDERAWPLYQMFSEDLLDQNSNRTNG